MAKKHVQKKIRKKDIIKEVKFQIDKDAFHKEIKCCGKKTKSKKIKKNFKGLSYEYEIEYCNKCKSSYLNREQGRLVEKFWIIELILEDKLIDFERKVNFDGKTHFIRFPKEVSKKWKKGIHANIKAINSETFIIQIEN